MQVEPETNVALRILQLVRAPNVAIPIAFEPISPPRVLRNDEILPHLIRGVSTVTY